VTGLLIAVLAVAVAAAIITPLAIRRLLKNHQAVMAGVVRRHLDDDQTRLRAELKATEARLLSNTAAHIGKVTESVGDLGDAVRARLLAETPAAEPPAGAAKARTGTRGRRPAGG
jgi:hypothetical protein